MRPSCRMCQSGTSRCGRGPTTSGRSIVDGGDDDWGRGIKSSVTFAWNLPGVTQGFFRIAPEICWCRLRHGRSSNKLPPIGNFEWRTRCIFRFCGHKSRQRSSVLFICFPASGAAMMQQAPARRYLASCAICGASFEGVVGPGRRERFCSDECRAVAIKKSRLKSAPKVGAGGTYSTSCAACGRTFEEKMGEGGRRLKLCSAACRTVERRRYVNKMRLRQRTEALGPMLPFEGLE